MYTCLAFMFYIKFLGTFQYVDNKKCMGKCAFYMYISCLCLHPVGSVLNSDRSVNSSIMVFSENIFHIIRVKSEFSVHTALKNAQRQPHY